MWSGLGAGCAVDPTRVDWGLAPQVMSQIALNLRNRKLSARSYPRASGWHRPCSVGLAFAGLDETRFHRAGDGLSAPCRAESFEHDS